ncbi:uncharacterized protein LOC125039130 [Penaeus chinensis]|uniref:uncharacterized protein LOC125039130 n=1 Tax=Penaeus chinensis TaxID=139456 RepID=UPI001FB78089|nr:uncharacterized protein LOC125039130 [Penaeus chinensis]XP_047488832.1 uncharacterized protein LOC125039130 [Penaeus chinensis]XP_047488833.1 uncharacterized protein LOC125039130 [Penaeus chinensis]XP_047488835.1 uncharacterized protein LOC125039130 [Penaeus chinensis]
MKVFTFTLIFYIVLQTSAKLLQTIHLSDIASTRFEENANMSFIFFATEHFYINLTLNKMPHLLCRREAEVILLNLDDGIGQCRPGVNPFEYHELRLILQHDFSFKIEDPSGAAAVTSTPSPLEVVITVGRSLDAQDPPSDREGAVFVTRKIEGCRAQPKKSAAPLVLIGVVGALALLLVLVTVVACILYLLVPPETIRRVLFRSGGNDPGCTALSSGIGQKDAQDTPSPPPRPINTHNASETRNPLAKVPSVPLAPPNAAATAHQNDARHSNHDDGYDLLHDPNYDYIEANVVRPVDRAILDQELAGANPKWKQPPGGFRKKSDPQTTGFRKLSDTQTPGFRKLSDTPVPKPPAAAPGHFLPFEDDEYINLGSGFPPPPQQHGPRGNRARY